jgi:hypothetical protein
MTTAVDIANPICQAQRAATGVVADMTTETQVLFLSAQICVICG